MSFKTGFFSFKARLAFIQLKKVFTKISILYHFNLEYHIQIKTNISSYTIYKVLRQLIS